MTPGRKIVLVVGVAIGGITGFTVRVVRLLPAATTRPVEIP
jgi:hypothetical protein